MFSTILSGGICGVGSYITHVEVDLARGLPGFDMVGKLSKEVTEARERVRVALKNSGIDIPPTHITVNLSPANLYKSGTGFDLPIAMGIMASLNYIPPESLIDILIIGELGLDGGINPVSGILPIVTEAANQGIKACLVPSANATEASYVPNITVYGADTFEDALHTLLNLSNTPSISTPDIEQLILRNSYDEDFADISGQDTCKRAALIAASGNHHLLITGPPGSGKTMIARRLRTIMPQLTHEEMLGISSIYSVAGMLSEQTPLITTRPFHSPHHGATLPSLMGGGRALRPGIISLCHNGILFLDEFPEFSKECIEALREPLENKTIQLSRATGTYTYPADFLLVAAANPCPCGYYPDRNRCNCSNTEIRRYKNRISGPIRDRIDLTVSSHKIEISHLNAGSNTPSSLQLRTMVEQARAIQQKRFEGSPYNYNSDIPSRDINLYCPLGEQESEYASQMYRQLDLSARSYHKLLRVARTIADLDNSPTIGISHLSEAVCYRG